MRRLTLLLVSLVLLSIQSVLAQSFSVKGTVVSAEDNEPMIGVTIMQEGTSNGVVTDIDGNYTIEIKGASKATLAYSYVGCVTQKHVVNAQTNTLNITLASDSKMMDEVVVVAYGVRKKGTIAGSVSAVKSEKIENVPAASFDQALQGQSTGLQVISSSGEPSKAATFQIRGTNSINSGKSPLFILDGVPISSSDFNTLSPNDIESISVLKDASSTSIYGARAANGVVVITSKRGLLVGSLAGLHLGSRLIPLRAGEQPLVNALAYDAKRRCYWIGTEGALYCADLQLRNFSQIPALNGNSIKCLSTDAAGNLYIGTDNGLYQMALSNAITHYIHDSRDDASIPNNIVWACFVDKWQNVWVGTDNGLSRLTTHTYYRYVSLDKITMSGEGNCLHAMLQTRNGEWWMGGTNGLIHFSRNADGYQNVAWYKQNSSAFPLSHNRVRKIYEDHDGDVWICTDHGINFYDRSSRQMRNFIVYDKSGKYSTAWAYDVLQDKKGRIWMGSYQGGVFVMDKAALLSGKTIADWHYSDKGKNALSGLHVGQMVMDGKGRIWVSTYTRLNCINPNDMKVVQVANSDVVNYLMADSKGNIWMGDNSSVTCYYAAGSVLGNSFSSKTWQIGGKVSTMCDVEGKIWVVSGNECCVINPEGESQRFMIPSVVPLNICYSRQTHEVMMGGNDGYVAISSDVAQKPKQFTRLMLAGIIVNGQACEERGEILKLKSDENNFTLQLTDLPFADHPSAVYAYKLEGSDHDWHYLNSGNIDITYNGLSYGDYHLTVHAVDGEGKIAAEVYSLDISVLPPWYLSWWCKLFRRFRACRSWF
jgi:TonB-dependent SusC/RagA subfamily outer membrane receptor